MKKKIKLKESDLINIVKKVIKEQDQNNRHWENFGFEDEESFLKHYEKVDEYASELEDEIYNEIYDNLVYALENIDFEEIVSKRQKRFMNKYGEYNDPSLNIYNENIGLLMSFKPKDLDIENMAASLMNSIFNFIELGHDK